MNPIQLVLISGMSGAGRTTALHTLEDLGFYCVDNLPIVLLPSFLEILRKHGEIERVALGIDARDVLFLGETPHVIEALCAHGYTPELVFLDAQNSVLIRRYKETRRVHPLDTKGDLRAAIERERRLLQALAPYVQTHLDTSTFTPHQLRDWFCLRYSDEGPKMHVDIVSFGYKNGILLDADLIFDVRFLKNPYFVPDLSRKTGLDKAVSDYVFSDPDAQVFLDKMFDMIAFLIPRYQREGKRYLTIGIGCTGGQHRSVALAEALYGRFSHDPEFHVSHRDVEQAVLREREKMPPSAR